MKVNWHDIENEGEYLGEINDQAEAYGWGTFTNKRENIVFSSTFKANKADGYCKGELFRY